MHNYFHSGANVNRVTTSKDHSVLSLACAGGHTEVVQLLLAYGADPCQTLKVSIISFPFNSNFHLSPNSFLSHFDFISFFQFNFVPISFPFDVISSNTTD